MPSTRPESKPDAAHLPDRHPVPQIIEWIEAILFLGGPPLSAEKFVTTFPSIRADLFEREIRRLAARYVRQRRPYRVRRTPAGYLLQLDPELAGEISQRANPEKGVRLNRQSIEVLALVAYRQPITAKAIAALAGYDPDGILRRLARRDLIARDPENNDQYITTKRFLDVFELASPADLPASEDLQQL